MRLNEREKQIYTKSNYRMSALNPIPFDVVKGYENIKLLDNPSVAATLYHHPPNQTNFEFWNVDRTLLMALGTHKIVNAHENDMYNENVAVSRLSSFIIAQLFGKTDYNVKDHHVMGFSESTNSIYSKLTDIHTKIGKQKMDGLYNTLNECIGDDYSKSKETRLYLLCLHKYNDNARVYMTMSIRKLSSVQIEHRHIQQSVRSILEPLLSKTWGYNVDPIPFHLSMLMHTTSLRFMQMLHPEVNELKIDPLHSMYVILQKQGFVPPSEKKTAYYNVIVKGSEYTRLRSLPSETYVSAGKLIDQCIGCNNDAKFRCGTCYIPIVCDNTICSSKVNHIHKCE